MPTPNPRNKIKVARGNIADLQASIADLENGDCVWKK